MIEGESDQLQTNEVQDSDETWRRLRRLTLRWWLFGPPLLLAAIGIFVIGLYLAAHAAWNGHMGRAKWFALGGLILSAVVLSVQQEHLSGRHLARSLLRNHCPSCGYDLRGSAPRPDGWTLCPEWGLELWLDESAEPKDANREPP